MKKLATLFNCLGFIIQYLAPVLLFGSVVPYTHDSLAKGLTAMGYIAGAVIVFFISKRLKEWVLEKPKSLKRGIILSIFPIVWWVLIFFSLGWINSFVDSFTQYWDKVIAFIIIGRGFYVAAEAMQDVDKETGNE